MRKKDLKGYRVNCHVQSKPFYLKFYFELRKRGYSFSSWVRERMEQQLIEWRLK